ncbi:hypothetical protein BJY59DRAFT_649371 [Rhodotorula toruloides]
MAWRVQQRSAHEQPAIFYSLALGAVGPVLVVAVPPIRKRYFGYKPAERIPQSYPRTSSFLSCSSNAEKGRADPFPLRRPSSLRLHADSTSSRSLSPADTVPSRPRQATEGYEDGWELKA